METTSSAETIVIETTPSAIVARVNAKLLDDATILKLTQSVDAAGGAAGAPALVVIDMARVEFLPSLCLGALVQILNNCKGRQQKVKLAGLRPAIRKTFSITRLDRVFELADSVEAAVA